MPPFVDLATFANWAGRPAWADSELADVLLTVVSDWIREHRPDTEPSDSAAELVCFEVARDSMLSGEFGPVVSFTKKVGHRERSVTIDRAAVARFITDRHKVILGLSIGIAPRWKFGD